MLGGRPKGAKNKTTIAVKEALTAAFQGIGGVPALKKWAKDNPTEFYRLWAKLLPQDAPVNDIHLVFIRLMNMTPAELQNELRLLDAPDPQRASPGAGEDGDGEAGGTATVDPASP